MISMMLFYSCNRATNRTGENKVQWNPHNIHVHTQMGHSTIVCITGPQKKCCRHCFIDYVTDTLYNRAWDSEKCLLSILTDCYIRWVFVRTDETVCSTVDLYGCSF